MLILLEQNYRSTQTILDVANSVISQNRNRTPKQLHTDNGQGVPVMVYEAYNEVEEAAFVADEIEKMVASARLPAGRLCRDLPHQRPEPRAGRGLRHARHQYKLIGATRFYERKEIKDALAYLRLIHNPADSVALERIINEPARGIGPKTIDALRTWAAEIGVERR